MTSLVPIRTFRVVGATLRYWGERMALVLFGVLLAAALMELGLRGAARFVGPRELPVAVGSRLRILSLGDSHTYGVYYPAAEAYPGQLQVELERRSPGRYSVLNLGLPGMNSSEIATRLPAWLDRYQPYAIILCVGVNNFWNRSDTEEMRQSGVVARWLAGLRLVRLGTLLALQLRTVDTPPNVIDRPDFIRTLKDDGRAGEEYRDAETGQLLIQHRGDIHRYLEPPEATAMLRRDLERILALTSARGVRLVLLTYAASPLPGRTDVEGQTGKMNEYMSSEFRRFGREHGVDLVDPHDRFFKLLPPEIPRETLFATAGEDHPNPRGYAEIARLVADAFAPPTAPNP